MPPEEPLVVVLGGINGAGKTTASEMLLGEKLALATFVNADAIARGLNAFAPEQAAFEAGRVMIAQLDDLAAKKADFAFESTLSGRGYISFMRRLRAEGYRIELYYFWLPSPEMSIERVRIRVQSGGHHIPEETIRQRFRKSLSNFWNDYRVLADYWGMYTNLEDGTLLTAEGSLTGKPVVANDLLFQKFMELTGHAT